MLCSVVTLLASANGLLLQSAFAPRTATARMTATSEEAAKRAWLAKLDQPSWGPGPRGSASRSPRHASHSAVQDGSAVQTCAWATDAYATRSSLTGSANTRAWVNEEYGYLQTKSPVKGKVSPTRGARATTTSMSPQEATFAWATDAYATRDTAPATNTRAWVNEEYGYLQTTKKRQ